MDSTNNNRIKRYLLEIFVIAMAAVILEVFVFEYQVWQDLGNQEIYVPLNLGNYTNGVLLEEQGVVVFDQSKGDCQIQFNLGALNHQEIRNISIKAYCPDGEAYWDDYAGNNYAVLHSTMASVRMVLTENENHKLLDTEGIGSDWRKADIIGLPSNSRPDLITMQFQPIMGQHVVLSEIRLNVTRKVEFSGIRFAGTMILLLFIRCLHPKSRLWKKKMSDLRGRKVLVGELIVGLVFAGIVIGMIMQNTVYIQGEGGFVPYRELAHALAKGQTWIDEKPSAELLALDDPYDFLQRMQGEVRYKLDYALFDGKYYVYFGIVPCLLFFLPLYLIAGIDVTCWAVVACLVVLLYAGVGLVLNELVKRYRRDLSFAAYLLLRVGMLAALSLPAIVSDPNAYYIPMLSAVVFYLYGLWFYYKAARAMDGGQKAMGYMIAGSVFMALVAGCRPQLVLAAVVAVPLLLRYLFAKEGKNVAIQWKRVAAFAIPYVVVAIGLMYYNAIRFGSPFDFGASYNLTFANTHNWKFHIEAVGAGIAYYLFRLPTFMASAPFLKMTHLDWGNPGLLANHTSTGGVYALYPILFGGFLLFIKRKGEQKEKTSELRWIGVLWLLLTLGMAVLTAAAGGLMDRYRQDFAIFAALALAAGILARGKGTEENTAQKEETVKKWGKEEWIHLLVLVTTLAAVLISALMYFEAGVWWIADANPDWYITLVRAVRFWG